MTRPTLSPAPALFDETTPVCLGCGWTPRPGEPSLVAMQVREATVHVCDDFCLETARFDGKLDAVALDGLGGGEVWPQREG